MRLIDADALKALIIRRRKEAKTLTGIDMVMVVDDAPTVDAAPVKHGKWEDYGHCSCCGWGWSDLVYDRTEQMSRMNYCPTCGACMDLEEQDAKEET